MIFDLPPPAIIQRAEPWELDLERKLAPLGLPRHVRRAIVSEFRRLEGTPPSIYKPSFADLARYGKDPALANILCPPIGWKISSVAFSLTFTAHAVDTSNASTYTFSSQAFGTADATRYMIVAFYAAGPSALSVDALTIGGVSATPVVENDSSGGTEAHVAIFKAAVPTGTSGTVFIDLDNTANRCGIGVWSLVGANPAETDTGSDITVSSSALSDTLDIPTGGAGIGYVGYLGNAAARTWTWTDLTEETGFDETIETTHSHSGASSTTAGSATRTATASGALNTGGGLVLAAWGP